MIVMAGSFKRYGVPARPGESAGKVCRVAVAIRYNAYSKSSRRSGKRHLWGQSTRSRGRLMPPSMRIMKKHCRTGVPLGRYERL